MRIDIHLLAWTLALTSPAAYSANAPFPMPGFGGLGDGIARERVIQTPGRDIAMALAVMPDERLVVGGVSMSGFNPELSPFRLSFMRLLPNGRVDPAFGPAGRGAFALATPPVIELVGMAVDANGDVVYGGWTTQHTGVVGKVTSGGVPVASFGQNGSRFIGPGVFTDPATMFIPRRLVPLRSGALLMVGAAGINKAYCAAIARITPQGNFDATFGTNGAVCISPPRTGPSAAGAHDVIELADGTLLAVGGALRTGGAGVDMFMARLASTGALDISFGTQGSGFAYGALDAGKDLRDEAFAVATDSRGRILIAGQASVDSPTQSHDMAVLRFTANGVIDTTFGNDGHVLLSDVFPSSFSRSAQGIQVLRDGRILVTGSTIASPTLATAIMFEEDGEPDTRFGVDGQFLQASPAADRRTILNPYLRSGAMSGDHLYFYGGIDLETTLPSSEAFGVAKFLVPLMRDGFDG